ncbi:Solute carrier family 25 member 38 [Pestalotiopsis fici W106-1]|uniref:Mitochondrial glycine transporter n=1 Tax=Pestalotiopsis fici (strain W106-1 / CGMCC3.15140) TaxID=1229662 RepID=W3XL64_PESFW|nr:Solute carrier family 25 member 38 [Pestalotiopsis fici W106-1]ETS86798.1 Solute carrier family 25 member 38 [Pestalotiopsis fici W106-1]
MRLLQSFHFVAGLCSGTLGAVLLQPIDLLKTRVQQSGSQSIRTTIREIAKSPNAVAAFWRGTVPSTLRTGFGSAVYFTTLSTIRQHATPLALAASSSSASSSSSGRYSSSSSLPKLSNTANLLSGAFARAFAGFLLMPLTILKVRYESNLYSYTSLAGAARDIYQKERIRGFFAGYGATAVRDAPHAGLYVLFYEQFKKRLSKIYGRSKGVAAVDGAQASSNMTSSLAATINFSSGAMASATCSFITNPFDAVKTRIQLQPHEYRNTLQAMSKMITEEGVRSLYDGLALRLTRKAISSALAWMLYEEIIRRAETTLSRNVSGQV